MPTHHKWIADVVEVMSEELDESTRKLILEKCGRNCVERSWIDKLRGVWKETEEIDTWINKLHTDEIWDGIIKQDGEIFVIFSKCYCPYMKDLPKSLKMPENFCECSIGWVKELFECIIEQDVKVELISSIIRGDEECKLKVGL